MMKIRLKWWLWNVLYDFENWASRPISIPNPFTWLGPKMVTLADRRFTCTDQELRDLERV